MSLVELLRLNIPAEIGVARRYALVLTRAPDQAEDLVQEALTRAIASAGSWSPDRALRPWLLAIVHNTHLKRRERQRLERLAVEEAAWEAEAAAPPDQPGRVELARTIAAMMALPEDQRTILVLVAFEGLAYRDVAEVLGVPIGTVMSRLARARVALRSATGRDPPGEAGPVRRALRAVE